MKNTGGVLLFCLIQWGKNTTKRSRLELVALENNLLDPQKHAMQGCTMDILLVQWFICKILTNVLCKPGLKTFCQFSFYPCQYVSQYG